MISVNLVLRREIQDIQSEYSTVLSVDFIANKYSWQSPYVYAANNPVKLIDVLGLGPGDPVKHTVVKGDNLTKIGKKYGVKIKDLKAMNNISSKNLNKLTIGQVLVINPEADFKNNPRGGYQNDEKSDGVETTKLHIGFVATDFLIGSGYENSVIVGGSALTSVQEWKEVDNLVNKGINKIMSHSKAIPGEAYDFSFEAGSLASNMWKGAKEGFDNLLNKKMPWEDNSQNSPIHVIGSFNMSIRVNANGTTATVFVYDSKTFKSFSDNHASEKYNRNRKKNEANYLTNIYQRYLWNINLPTK